MNLKQRLLGLAASLALVAFTAGVPFALTGFGLSPLALATHPLWSRLLAPDDGTMAYVGLGLIAWALWAVLAWCLTLEIVAVARGTRAPQIRGLSAPQQAARTLLTWAAMLFIAVPATTSTSAPTAQAAGAAMPAFAIAAPAHPDHGTTTITTTRTRAAPVATTTEPAATETRQPPAAVPGAVQYTVKRGDSLWKIAQKVLGDPLRYTQIAAINAELLGGKPDFITPGTVLLLPADTDLVTTPADDEPYIVQAGDTLSQIAQDQLGNATRYPDIFDASQHLDQPGGERLTDPNLIKPGWQLNTTPDVEVKTVAQTAVEPVPPPTEAATPPAAERATAPPAGPVAPSPRAVKEPSPSPTDEPTPTRTPEAVDEPAPDAETSDHTPSTMGSLLPGLLGPGALLAGALLLVVRAMRRTQLRYRQPGQMLAPPPPDLGAVDRTTKTSGAPNVAKLQSLDAMLRELAAHYPSPQDHPAVLAVELSDEHAWLHLASDAVLPSPWTGQDRVWSAPMTEYPPAAGVPPYPLLVTIGSSPDGHVWLLNLEQTGALVVGGDATLAEALGRFIAAELALNPWSMLVNVHAVGIAEELAQINPLRFTHFAEDDPAALVEIERAVDSAGGVLTFDPDGHIVLLTTAARGQGEGVRDLITAIRNHPARPGAAIVMLGGAPQPDDVAATIIDGRLSLPLLRLELDAAGLSVEEARGVAAFTCTTEDTPCIPYPVDERTTEGIAMMADAGGALLPAMVEDRPDDGAEPAGETSLLPLPTEVYVETSAATAQDVATLSPRVPSDKFAKFEDEHPDLDADVADWFAGNDCSRPRLTVLGPVTAHGRGNAMAAAKRRPYLTGLLGYLALHPNGVTSDELQTIAGGTSVRDAIKTLRTWMGHNPRTGLPFIPKAGDTRAAQACGQYRYQVDDVLVDWDLFKLLRVRAQLRGSSKDGIDDLELALALVSGVPFTQAHSNWQWLDESDRLDLIAPCAIADVAHAVVMHAMAINNLALARRAADVAILAAPEDETARLDLIDVLAAEGHAELARTKLQHDIIDRTDDEHGPIMPPGRTAEIIARRWTT
ncbi:MAG: LysM peptidoglycan-binding domain-containing protein [Cellulomonadaceae bacterium]